jgi:ABC-type transport system involved in cytochrome c biogenesis permease subunit
MMPTLYMFCWSFIIVAAFSTWRLQTWNERILVTAVTLLVLFMSQSLFVSLATSAGLNPTDALQAPEQFLQSGPVGWLALLVMPCGWLGPFVGFNLIQRIQEESYQ